MGPTQYTWDGKAVMIVSTTAGGEMRCYRSRATVDNYPVVLHFTTYQSGSEGAGWINATSGETNLETANLRCSTKYI